MRIECTLPNASENIGGIDFVRTEAGTMVTVDDVTEADAARFLSIQGYAEFTGKDVKVDGAPGMDALREQAEALGIKVNGRWGEERLRSEIEQAAQKQ